MAVTKDLEAAIRVRNMVAERSPAGVNITVPHILALVPTALELWTRAIMSDREKRDFLRSTFTPALTSGVLDLTTYVDGTAAAISLQELRNSTIYTTISGVRTPMTWVSSQAQLNNPRFTNSAPAVYLEGTTLRTRNTDGSLTSLGSAALSFTVTSYPTNFTNVPTRLEGDFIAFLADVVTRELAVDGRK